MDRERLRRWLTTPHRTWRWRLDESTERYDAVESTDDGLLWFEWSHEHGEDGMQESTLQSYEDFRDAGPPLKMPKAVEGQLRDWLATLKPAV